MTDLIGKVGGTVFQRGKFGSILRRRVFPVNPQSDRQMVVRSDTSNVAHLWSSLTDNDRLQWSFLAELYPVVKNGRQNVLSGFLFFSKCNRNRQEIGEAMITAKPVIGTPQSFEMFDVDVVTTPGSEEIKVNFDPAINADTKVEIYGTQPLRPGNKSAKTRFRKLGYVDDTFLTGSSIKDIYIAKFGGMPTTGEKIMFEIKPVVIASGYANLPMRTVSIGTV